jgi:WD40 repeat protein
MRLWDFARGKELRRWSGVVARCAAFSPDGKVLAFEEPEAISLFDPATGAKVLSMEGGREGSAMVMRFSPDGKSLLVGCHDGEIRRWERASGKKLKGLSGHILAFSADGTRLAVACGPDVRILDGTTLEELRRFPRRGAFSHYPPGGYFSGGLTDDANTLVAADWNRIRILDTKTGRERDRFEGPWAAVTFVRFSADGQRLLSASDQAIRWWDVRTGKELRRLEGHKQFITTGCASADGALLATGSWDGTVRLWDGGTGKEIRRLAIEPNTRPLLALSPDGRMLAAKPRYGHGQGILLWDTSAGKELRRCGYGNGGNGLAFPSDSALVVLETDVSLLDPASGQLVREFQDGDRHACQPTGLAVSPDGRVAASGWPDEPGRGEGPSTAALWETASGKKITQLRGHKGPIEVLAFSHDGRTLATGGVDRSIRLWDISTGIEQAHFDGHRGRITSLAFSEDDTLLASGSSDTTALVWDVRKVTKKAPGPAVRLRPGELHAFWSDLRQVDAGVAYQALWGLVAAAPQAVPFLRERLDTPAPTPARIRQFVAALDDDDFHVRQEASHALEGLGAMAEPHLRAALAHQLSPEARRRVKAHLAGPAEPQDNPSPETLRRGRAVQALEYIGTPEAIRVLTALAAQEPDSPIGLEAKAALRRLNRDRP